VQSVIAQGLAKKQQAFPLEAGRKGNEAE